MEDGVKNFMQLSTRRTNRTTWSPLQNATLISHSFSKELSLIHVYWRPLESVHGSPRSSRGLTNEMCYKAWHAMQNCFQNGSLDSVDLRSLREAIRRMPAVGEIKEEDEAHNNLGSGRLLSVILPTSSMSSFPILPVARTTGTYTLNTALSVYPPRCLNSVYLTSFHWFWMVASNTATVCYALQSKSRKASINVLSMNFPRTPGRQTFCYTGGDHQHEQHRKNQQTISFSPTNGHHGEEKQQKQHYNEMKIIVTAKKEEVQRELELKGVSLAVYGFFLLFDWHHYRGQRSMCCP